MPQNRRGSENPFDKLIAERGSDLTFEEFAELCRKEPQAWIEHSTREIDSVEQFDEIMVANGCQVTLKQMMDLIEVGLKTVRQEAESQFWPGLVSKLRDADSWQRLSTNPTAFSKELNRTFGLVRKWMNLSYGIRSQRPAKNVSRDRKIYELKLKEPDLSFGLIGRKFNCSAKVAERACKRYQKAQKKRLRDELTVVLEINNALDARTRRHPPQKAE